MSVDLLKRMDYADVFDFDKFHEAFKQKLAIAKGGERFTLVSFIEDYHEFWRDYDLSKSVRIAEILEEEVADVYGIVSDPDDYIELPAPKKPEKKQSESAIRDLAKEFLENKTVPQDLEDILEYVNGHRENKTTHRNLQSSLYQDKTVFIRFDNGKWGLCSIDYEKQQSSHNDRIPYDDQESKDLYASDVELTYNVSRTDLASQEFELRYSTKREHKPTVFLPRLCRIVPVWIWGLAILAVLVLTF